MKRTRLDSAAALAAALLTASPAAAGERLAVDVDHTVIAFTQAGNPATAYTTRWSGRIAMPTLDDLGDLVSIEDEEHDRGDPLYYLDPEGTLTHPILDSNRQWLGTYSVSVDGRIQVLIDLDRDGEVDALDVVRPDLSQVLVVRDGLGRQFVDDWLAGLNPLCRPANRGALREQAEVAPEASMMGCTRDSNGQPYGGGTPPPEPEVDGADPIADACESINKSNPPIRNGGVRAGDGDSGEGAAVTALVTWGAQRAFNALRSRLATGALGAAAAGRYLTGVGAFIAASEHADTESYACENGLPNECIVGHDDAVRANKEAEAERIRQDKIDRAEHIIAWKEERARQREEERQNERDAEAESGDQGRPAGPDHDAALAEVCARRDKRRIDWKRSLRDVMSRSMERACDDLATNPSERRAEGDAAQGFCDDAAAVIAGDLSPFIGIETDPCEGSPTGEGCDDDNRFEFRPIEDYAGLIGLELSNGCDGVVCRREGE